MTTTLDTPRRRSKVAQAHRDRGTGVMARALARQARKSAVTYQRRIQRHREMLREMVVAIECGDSAELRHWLRAHLHDALAIIDGPRLPYTADLLAGLALKDGIEDGALARLIADPRCPQRIRAWLRAAEVEHTDRADAIAAARAELEVIG